MRGKSYWSTGNTIVRLFDCSTAQLLNRYIAILSKKCFYHGVQPVVHGDSTVQLLYGLENTLRHTSTPLSVTIGCS